MALVVLSRSRNMAPISLVRARRWQWSRRYSTVKACFCIGYLYGSAENMTGGFMIKEPYLRVALPEHLHFRDLELLLLTSTGAVGQRPLQAHTRAIREAEQPSIPRGR